MADSSPLDAAGLETILTHIPQLTIGVIGDLFLDRYLDLDADLTEPSLETGLDAYQVVHVRSNPGAAGTVLNNLVSLGVGRVCPLSVLGKDGEGYELRRALKRMPAVDTAGLIFTSRRRTPTYTKPMLRVPGQPVRELNRLDIKNRRPMPKALESRLIRALREVWPHFDALVVLDQVSEEDCGVITATVRSALNEMSASKPGKFVLADSRERIALFRGMSVKPNRQEALRGMGVASSDREDVFLDAVAELARRTEGWVFCTEGARGILLASAKDDEGVVVRRRIPAYPVSGPIDIVGAGDSTSAAIVCALASGVSVEAAAAFGNLVASITIQQLGTTGTASPAQVRERWCEVTSPHQPSAPAREE
jgi:rfaE bifunctional protein kinase chain/domain